MSADATLVDVLRSAAATAGDARGFRYYDSATESTSVGYAALDARARAIAVDLRARGYETGDAVVLAIGSGLAFIETFFGAQYAGLTVVPAAVGGFGAPGSAERLRGMVRVSQARAVLADADVLAAIDGLEGPGIPVLDVAGLGGDAEAWVAPGIDGAAIAGLLFTSGSTGEPKGVIMTHASAVASALSQEVLTRGDVPPVFVGWAPLHHVMGLCVQVVLPVVFAMDAVLTSPAQFQRRPVSWLRLMSTHRGTITVAGNFAFDLCVQFATDELVAELDLSQVTAFISGSEPVRTETIARFVDRFAPSGVRLDMVTPAYGSTEGMLVSFKRPGSPVFIIDADADRLERGELVRADGDGTIEMVSCGPPVEGVSVVIADPEDGAPLRDGLVGEIRYAGPTVSPGYWRDADATSAVFGQALRGGDVAYARSGDLGALLDGELFITGRVKDLIIVRGRNIYPQDLESAAADLHPALGISAAFELTGHPSVAGIVVEVDPERVGDTSPEELSEALRTALMARFSLPSLAIALLPLGGVPRTASGKVRRSIARGSLEQGTLETSHASGFSTSS